MCPRLFFWVLVWAAVALGTACGTEPIVQPSGELAGHGGCKKGEETTRGGEVTSTPGPSEACIRYSYSDRGGLSLQHINAGFNCCPGDLTADVMIDEGAIRISEREAGQGCRCVCLYDLDIVIGGLEPGIYTVEVDEPYLREGNEVFRFAIDLVADREGEICISRSGGPWR